jgi:hypothetical protein
VDHLFNNILIDERTEILVFREVPDGWAELDCETLLTNTDTPPGMRIMLLEGPREGSPGYHKWGCGHHVLVTDVQGYDTVGDFVDNIGDDERSSNNKY